MSNLIRWNPFFDPFEDMDKMFSDMTPARRGQPGFTPAVDIYEEGNDVVVETQLAGIDPDKVDISVENDVLCIQGEGEKKNEVEDKDYYRKEIRRGGFHRSIPLPSSVDGDNASAVAENGVLKVSIPKREETKAKKIKIEKKSK